MELERPKREISAGMYDFAYGYAKLKTGESDIAKVYLNRLRNLADTTKAKFRFTEGGQILKVLAAILEGEILWSEGKKQQAMMIFRKGVNEEDKLPYDEPEPLPFSVRHWLGDALLDLEQYSSAEKVFANELADHPNNGWSLYGLRESLKGQNKPTEQVQAQFEGAWARADVFLDGTKF